MTGSRSSMRSKISRPRSVRRIIADADDERRRSPPTKTYQLVDEAVRDVDDDLRQRRQLRLRPKSLNMSSKVGMTLTSMTAMTPIAMTRMRDRVDHRALDLALAA